MSQESSYQPRLSDLMAGYLSQEAAAHAAGLGKLDISGEVVPFEAGPVQLVDPRPAWEEATAVLCFFPRKGAVGSWPMPTFWPQLVAMQEPAVALAFCLGNFPQLMRHLHLLLHKANVELRPTPGRPMNIPELADWVKQTTVRPQFPQILLALGCLRLARHFDHAMELVQAWDKSIPAQWQAPWANEKAGLSWHAGRWEEAARWWQNQEPSLPVLFNRGMADLFLDRPNQAQKTLAEAVAQLPETGGWHHLGHLYLKKGDITDIDK